MKRAKKIKRQLDQRRPSLKQPLPKQLLSNSCNFFDVKFDLYWPSFFISTHNGYITHSSFISSSAQYVTWSFSYLSLWNFINNVIRKTSCSSYVQSTS